MKTPIRAWAVVTAFVMVLGGMACANADEIAVAGRSVMDANKAAVITVRVVLKQQFAMPGMPSHEEESAIEAAATVLDPSGLAVLSLSQLEPEAMFAAMMEEEDSDMKMETKVSDVKYLRSDGGETPAKIVLRDKDLDLAFVRPENKSDEKYAFIDLNKAVKPGVLDPLFVLTRLGKVASRVHAIQATRVQAIIEKPRTLYVPGGDVDKVGAPVFTQEGAPVGLMVARYTRGGGASFMDMFGDGPAILVVLPGADVMEAAKQAPSYDKAPVEPEPAAKEAPAPEKAEAPKPAEGSAK